MTRGPIHLGDLVTACQALRVDSPEGTREIARVLGLPVLDGPSEQGGEADVGAARSPGGAAAPLRHQDPPGAGPLPGGPPATRAQGRPYQSAERSGRRLHDLVPEGALPGNGTRPAAGSLTTVRGPDPHPRPAIAATPPSLPLLEERSPAARRSPPPPWDPRTERGIMLAAASTDVEGREVDRGRLMDLALRSIAGQVPVQGGRIPRRVRPTTREGAQLLLDRSSSMRPFWYDHLWIAELAGRVLRRDRVQVQDLVLRRGVSNDGGRTWQPYRPPAPGRPVLLLSDLGVFPVPFADRTATTAVQWLPWFRLLRRAGNPVTCLTPFPPEAYPPVIRQTVALVPLDRRTSIRSAHTETRRFQDRGPQR